MMTEKITGKDLIESGLVEGRVCAAALPASNKLLADGQTKETVLFELRRVNGMPASFLDHPVWGDTAQILHEAQQAAQMQQLRDEPAPLQVWGKHLIDEGAFKQINQAALLPVSLRVALMPDAHVGYGLPIGGVAALEGAIAPYMVGVDIGCRMHATIFERNPIHLQQAENLYKKMLLDYTFFGRRDVPAKIRVEHSILDDPRWELLPRHLHGLKEQAQRQLGSSGGGNHFVEWTKLTVTAENRLDITPGKYIALVSHSGSRGVGFKIAKHYSDLAKQICHFLPADMRNLGYLDYAGGEGEEYESAMSLAGDFARANHEVLHARIVDALGAEVAGTLQNHHNYAWKVEQDGDTPVFIHRKGATPAAVGTLGIIPGTMATPGFLVEGKCETPDQILSHPSLNSAGHGAGRRMGRKQAIRALDAREVRKFLNKQGVTLIGGGLDEAPKAYKNSRDVIAAQTDLVRVWAEFQPVIVRMESSRNKSLGRGRR